ncbi:MAG: hypothetical protein PVSMB7_20440 [Chloroflexota bacterium]
MIQIELTKQVRRARGWVTLGAMIATSGLLTGVVALTRPAQPERVGDWLSVTGNTTGMSLPLVTLNAMVIFLFPLAVAVFAGETVAGEAAWGSLRYALARPLSRVSFLVSKACVAALFSISAILVAALTSLLVGVAAFGWRPLTVVDLQHTSAFRFEAATYSPEASIGLIALASGFIVCTTASTFAFSLLLSTLTNRPFSAVAGGIGLGLFSRALDNIPGLNALSPWLPVTNEGATLWTKLFTAPAQTGAFAHFFVVQGVYTACFLVATFWWFSRADIFD